jgi:3-oxoacyl-(acyl-carrier-protein) synthase/NAD(P)-dependent dehydrogenase (short-subunit alcohol dehydrogenase family)/aryl carrier-like protein
MPNTVADIIAHLPPKRLALLALELHEQLSSPFLKREGIAIVGAGCRLPGGVNGPSSFWKTLLDAKDGIGRIPEERWAIDDFYDPVPGTPGRMYTREGGFLENIDLFDAEFFGISAREASRLDPQHRLLLEVAWEALEDAGQSPEALRGTACGVFTGITTCDYAAVLQEAGAFSQADLFGISGTALNAAPGRVSYTLGLQGPSISIDSACSSSLVAVHQACTALWAKECDVALAGGVNAILTPHVHVLASQARMLAADGRCKTFDQFADGFTRAEGCVLLVLKRLPDALANRDRVMAVIAGSAVNHGGASGGFSVPNPKAQAAVVIRALLAAGVDPHAVGFVETHGTGTSLGDPIEVRALADALAAREPGRKPVWLGAAKSNFGHTESAAGALSLLKAALAVQQGTIPPNLHCNTPNEAIDWNHLPFQLPQQATSWPAVYDRRVAGVSSFGMSGTNAHVVVTEGAALSPGERKLPEFAVLPLSGKSAAALRELAQRYTDFLAANPPFGDVCFTAASGRTHFDYRLAIVTDSCAAAIKELSRWLAGESIPNQVLGECPAARWTKGANSYIQGETVDWGSLWETWEPRRIALPTYPFERQRHWATPTSSIRNLFLPVWKPVDLGEARPLSGRWLVIGPAGNRIASLFPDAVRIASHDEFPPGAWAGVVVSLPDAAPLLSENGPGPSAAVSGTIRFLLRIARWLHTSPAFPMWFVTRGAQAVQSVIPSAQAAAWGFIRTLAIENGNRTIGICDVDSDSVDLLPSVLGQSAETQLTVRGRATYALRATVTTKHFRSLEPRPDRTYLITGGLGGVGEICARLLFRRGARHVVLTGRRPLDEERRSRLHALSPENPPRFVQSDVASAAETAALFDLLRAEYPPLAGIVHSALMLADRPAALLSDQDAEAILAPKIAGTWNLHSHSLDRPLDFFLLLSSASGIFGNGGQCAYAAGNAFQDAFAHARRAAGLSALSINLGPVEDTGAVRNIAVQRQFPPFVKPLSIPATERGIETLLSADEPQFVLCGLDTQGLRHLSEESLPAILRELVSARAAEPVAVSLAERLSKEPAGNQTSVLETWLRDHASAVLERAPATLESDRPLQEYGLDSLLALELRNRYAKESALELAASLLFDYPTIEALKTHFASRLIQNAEPAMSTEDPFDETSAAALLEKLTAEVLGFEGQR